MDTGERTDKGLVHLNLGRVIFNKTGPQRTAKTRLSRLVRFNFPPFSLQLLIFP